jgi:hypothetical protein
MVMPGNPDTARHACLRWPREPWSSVTAARGEFSGSAR